MTEPKSLIERAESASRSLSSYLCDNPPDKIENLLRELAGRIKELEELASTLDQRRLQSIAVWQKLCDERNTEISHLSGIIEDVKKYISQGKINE